MTAVDDLEQGGSLLNHPVALSGFEQFVLMGLLLSHGHNYSAALLQPTPAVASRDVRRAIDFIEAHLASPIAMADIIDAAAVSGRALFKHFKHFTGQSPMQYIRDARFRQVRRALAHAEPGQRVSDIAGQWGFVHLGRFSREYRQRFGEPPSATLRHARL
jgi:AraC-like DNA-binding protein